MSDKTKAMLILILTATYVFSPIDVVPDVVPFLGNIDDFLAMYFGMTKVVTLRQGA